MFSTVKCKAICLVVTAEKNVGHAAEQWFKAEQQIENKMDEKKGVAMAHSNSRAQPDQILWLDAKFLQNPEEAIV